MRIDAKGLYHRELNELVHTALNNNSNDIILDNVNGQRYIGCGLSGDYKITINGVPGNDLAAFMNGPTIVVNSNAQDGIGNTMNSGEIIVYGNAGDIVGHSMRGGRIFIQGDVGYRVGIHMKAYQEMFPVVIVGGNAGDFLGEYMAGGLLVVLGLTDSDNIVGDFIGTGMHEGSIFIRGKVDERCLGKEVKIADPQDKDMKLLTRHLVDFCKYFNLDLKKIINKPFIKLYPYSHRPYGRIYAY